MAELLVGTRKGLATLTLIDGAWTVRDMAHLGVPVSYAFRDGRSGTTWAALDHGHWGVKLQRCLKGGQWEEVTAPAYPDGEMVGESPAKLEYGWCMAQGGDDQPGRIYLGTNPGGLFRSDDEGATWQLVRGLWDHATRSKWFGGGRDTPGIHSILVDPRDSRRVLVAISCAGVLETLDDGETWRFRNEGMRGDFLPDPAQAVGQDPHLIVSCPAQPDMLWQQNHCGVYRSVNGAKTWHNKSQDDGPVGFGFAVAVHPTQPNTAWVVPGISDVHRTTVGGALVVCRTDDGGDTWREQRNGLPQDHAYDLVYRHALDLLGDRTLAFGSTTGNLWLSDDGGEAWRCISHTLPPIYSVRFAP